MGGVPVGGQERRGEVPALCPPGKPACQAFSTPVTNPLPRVAFPFLLFSARTSGSSPWPATLPTPPRRAAVEALLTSPSAVRSSRDPLFHPPRERMPSARQIGRLPDAGSRLG